VKGKRGRAIHFGLMYSILANETEKAQNGTPKWTPHFNVPPAENMIADWPDHPGMGGLKAGGWRRRMAPFSSSRAVGEGSGAEDAGHDQERDQVQDAPRPIFGRSRPLRSGAACGDRARRDRDLRELGHGRIGPETRLRARSGDGKASGRKSKRGS
jgi:hypothetical protein